MPIWEDVIINCVPLTKVSQRPLAGDPKLWLNAIWGKCLNDTIGVKRFSRTPWMPTAWVCHLAYNQMWIRRIG